MQLIRRHHGAEHRALYEVKTLISANFHTHTFRCHHAEGTEREYIETALGLGMKTLGFSDHTPYFFDGDYYSGFRMDPEQLPDYVRTLTELILHQLMTLTDQYPLSEADIAMITTLSALHDIGKISIPTAILNKPGKLTAEEFEIMKTHTTIGDEILATMTEYQDDPLVHFARQICRWHHERWDGKGYPDGLKGNDIPIGAQVVALADVYDALTSTRVYKPPYTHGQAVEMIMNGECGQFNPLLLECLRRIAPQLPNILHSEAQTKPGCPAGAQAAEKAT